MQRLLRPWRNLAASMWTNMSLKFTWTWRTSWWPPVPSCAMPPFTKSTMVSEKWWKKWSDLPECHKATESSSSGERALGLALPLSYPHVKRQTAARSSSPRGPLVAPEEGELEQCKRWHALPRTRHLLRWSRAGSNWSVTRSGLTRSHCRWFWAVAWSFQPCCGCPDVSPVSRNWSASQICYKPISPYARPPQRMDELVAKRTWFWYWIKQVYFTCAEFCFYFCPLLCMRTCS